MSTPVDALAVLDAEIADISGLSCREDDGERALRERERNLRATRANVAELITELRNAHEIIKLAMARAATRSLWLRAIDDAGLCGDGVTRFHERQELLSRVGGAA